MTMKRFQERASTAVSLLLYSFWTGISGPAGLQLDEALCEFSAARLMPDNQRNGKVVLPSCMLMKRCKNLATCLCVVRWSLTLREEQAFRNRYNINTEESGWRG